MKKHVVIVAGGSGSRMKSDVPKQFLNLNGRPILMHTIEAFYAYDAAIDIIVVLPTAEISYWEDLLFKHEFDIPHRIAPGGATRSDSVRQGIELIDGEGWVAIHDGARPLVSAQVIDNTYQQAVAHGNAIAAVPLKDSLRHVEGTSNAAVNRSAYYLIQTPQTFSLNEIKRAFDLRKEGVVYTDDASVLEAAGYKIHLATGDYENIKVTTSEDLIIAEALLSARQ